MTSSVELAAQLCSRLCHDLLSPVGALNNGLELLAEENDPAMRQRCMDLLDQSARTSTGKLQFFRLAYGAGGGPGESVPLDEVKDAVEGLAGPSGRIAINWVLADTHLPARPVKVLLNLAAIGMEALPRGGTLDIGAEMRDGTVEIVVRASGARIAFDEEVGEMLDGSHGDEVVSSRTAPACMTRLLAEETGGGLQHMLSQDALLLGAMLPNG